MRPDFPSQRLAIGFDAYLARPTTSIRAQRSLAASEAASTWTFLRCFCCWGGRCQEAREGVVCVAPDVDMMAVAGKRSPARGLLGGVFKVKGILGWWFGLVA